jgi:catechol 2,3-dioxygenase
MVRKLDRSESFYREILDLTVTERYDSYRFLAFDAAGPERGERRHHDIALQGIGADAPGPGRGVGLYHAAFEIDDAAGLGAVAERLEERGIEFAPVDHGISKALYFDDPDGNGLEVYLDTRAASDRWAWEGMSTEFDPRDL